ncbi:MAG TPA: histidine kinase [Terriglobales bacterium]|nr:histidine kinase [Terriglobales bacterium]
MGYKRLIGVAGLIAWILVGLPAFIYHAGAPSWDWRWVLMFAVFGGALAADLWKPRPVLLFAESAAAIGLVLLRCNGFEGTLLVVLAMQLGGRIGRTPAVAWMVMQTALLVVAVSLRLSPRAALLLAPPYLGFQLLAFFVFHTMAREAAVRTELAATNAELRALQEILAESTRMAERLRLAHELHDALGHRLTALTLNLEALVQCTHGPEKGRVELCRSLAGQVLADIREIVAESKARESVPISQTLATLVSAVPWPRVHLTVAESLRVCDPEEAHALVRCTQEIMTNAARHSGAENLWIVIEQDGDGVRLRAHDDGRGREEQADGFGLRGMRERIEKVGGQIQFSNGRDHGFGITAMLPKRSGT